MNRKQRRERNRKLKKLSSKGGNLNSKLGLFDLIPEDCMICHEKFDKSSKEMAMTWNVVVREKEKKVRVYCPPCWSKAQNLLKELGINDNEAKEQEQD